ncbi:MAG: hypothetical protein KAR38_13645 [Calditrichia bacterium]|nr:hypothetical protein [Calditrichia bacterium]
MEVNIHPGLIGGIIGSLIGLAGGIVGTYFSIKNTNSQEEKTFMIRMAVYAWLSILTFLVLMFVLPMPYNFLLWIPYGILLLLGIRYVNKKQAEITKLNTKNEENK